MFEGITAFTTTLLQIHAAIHLSVICYNMDEKKKLSNKI
jgi:hypothetical protein